jgi:hypothetical protein
MDHYDDWVPLDLLSWVLCPRLRPLAMSRLCAEPLALLDRMHRPASDENIRALAACRKGHKLPHRVSLYFDLYLNNYKHL